jgi:hypothetical protein
LTVPLKKQSHRVELFRSSHAQRLSIVDLCAFVTGFAVWFGGIRIAGVYGFVLGCFALQAASGRMLRRNDWQLGAAAGAITMLGSLTAAWVVYGTIGEIYPAHVAATQQRLRTAERGINNYREEHDRLPEQLAELEKQVQFQSWEYRDTREALASCHYVASGEDFQLTFLGDDGQTGGEGRSADVPLVDVDKFSRWRIAPVTFFMHEPGSGVMIVTLLFSVSIAAAAAFLFHRDSGQIDRDYLAVGILGGATSAIGCFLVRLSLAFL